MNKRERYSLRSKLGRKAKADCVNSGCDSCPFATCIVEIQTDNISSNTCPYFVKYVLPSDPALEAEYMNELPTSHPMKPKEKRGQSCATCGIKFERASNRQRYCTGCASENEKKRTAERQKLKRLNDSLKEHRERNGLDA